MTSGREVQGTVHEDTIVAAGQPWSGTIKKGDVLRIIDIEGQQAVDFICFNAHDMKEALDHAVTIRIPKSIVLRKGMRLYSNLSNALFTLEEDTIGYHDLLCGCCSREINKVRYGRPGEWSCRDNFLQELGRYGLDSRSIVPNVNFFMDIPISQDGRIEIKPAPSRAGDFVDLRAEMDSLAVISNCPQTLNPANGRGPTPIRVIIFSKPPK
jgi:urea carboxylase-associated protein 1